MRLIRHPPVGIYAAGLVATAVSAVALFVANTVPTASPVVLIALTPAIVAQHRLFPPAWGSLAPALSIALYQLLFLGRAGWATHAPNTLIATLGGSAFVLAIANVRERAHYVSQPTRYNRFIVRGVAQQLALLVLQNESPLSTYASHIYCFAHQPIMLQALDMCGLFGLAALVAASNYAAALLALAHIDASAIARGDAVDALSSSSSRGKPPPRRVIALFALLPRASSLAAPVASAAPLRLARIHARRVALLLLGWLCYGAVRSFQAPCATQPTVRVALVQHPCAADAAPCARGAGLDALVADVEVAALGGARIVATSEASADGAALQHAAADAASGGRGGGRGSEYVRRLQNISAATGATLAIGATRSLGGGGAANEVLVVSPSGVLGAYGKHMPVSFDGERSDRRYGYPTWRVRSRLASGDGLAPLAFELGVVICFDMDYTRPARTVAQRGAALLLAPTHDWADEAGVHWRGAVYRAVENRVPLVKPDYGWDSAVVDGCGASDVWLNTSARGERRTIARDVPLGDGGGTVAGAMGDLIGWVGALGCVVQVVASVAGVWRGEM